MLHPRNTLRVLSLGLCLLLVGGYAGAGTDRAAASGAAPEAPLGQEMVVAGYAGLEDWGLRLPESVSLFLFGTSLIVAARSYRSKAGVRA